MGKVIMQARKGEKFHVAGAWVRVVECSFMPIPPSCSLSLDSLSPMKPFP